MSDKARKPVQQEEQLAAPIANPSAAMMENGQRAFSRWLEGLLALSQEMTQFTQGRLQEDMAAWSTLMGCHDASEALDHQRRFAATASQQYADAIAKLSRMMVHLAQEGFAAVQRAPQPRS